MYFLLIYVLDLLLMLKLSLLCQCCFVYMPTFYTLVTARITKSILPHSLSLLLRHILWPFALHISLRDGFEITIQNKMLCFFIYLFLYRMPKCTQYALTTYWTAFYADCGVLSFWHFFPSGLQVRLGNRKKKNKCKSKVHIRQEVNKCGSYWMYWPLLLLKGLLPNAAPPP